MHLESAKLLTGGLVCMNGSGHRRASRLIPKLSATGVAIIVSATDILPPLNGLFFQLFYNIINCTI